MKRYILWSCTSIQLSVGTELVLQYVIASEKPRVLRAAARKSSQQRVHVAVIAQKQKLLSQITDNQSTARLILFYICNLFRTHNQQTNKKPLGG
ncbi:hypothetical protein GGR57DRAFT_480145 [Xylariaceae sp. FL1272]|nr:hypothetical protein GGR57DRAFT_480145 [Xylariaceae sp. FL1272]